MTALTQPTMSSRHSDQAARAIQWRALANQACQRIAPVWPLDSFVAVNPYLGLIDQPFSRVAEYLESTAGERMFMDRGWFAEKVAKGDIIDADLAQASAEFEPDSSLTALLRALMTTRRQEKRLPLLYAAQDRRDAPHLSEFVIEQLGGFLAARYDRGQALWRWSSEGGSLYTEWRRYTLIDRSARAAGLKQARANLHKAPGTAEDALVWALDHLNLPESSLSEYLFATLKSIGGWASWCRYLQWQAELDGQENHDLFELLVARLVWAALIALEMPETELQQWRRQLAYWQDQRVPATNRTVATDEVLLTAAEIAFRRPLIEGLKRSAAPEKGPNARPMVQAAFCIDVRSEVFRRHLEAQGADIQTLGFAGFFGVPTAYCRLGETSNRTHMPVLLKPTLVAEETGSAETTQLRLQRLGRSASWKQFKLSAASCFTFVESAGLSYVPRLLADTLGWHRSSIPPDEAGLTPAERAELHPQLHGANGALTIDEKIDLAEKILRGLGLNETFAPWVILAGHGSSTTNNPHRAGLDCGACAGQTGELSARVTANLLNEPAVREGLAARGRKIPKDTRFIAAMHDTTTDHVQLLDADAVRVPDTLPAAFQRAGDLTRLERLVRLDTEISAPDAERHSVQRGRDWSQVRPEWGLAGNAAFIAAPRWRSQGMHLDGRAFLHDYAWENDSDYAVLKLIMTAPLIVANWINLQYYGSTVDNARQGSGNKVLQNIVGGLIGVLEGNGGDLRAGLSLQSVHDGQNWRHEPVRLSAFIEAPIEAIEQVIAGHDMLRNLLDNRWMHLLHITPDGGVLRRFAVNDWRAQ